MNVIKINYGIKVLLYRYSNIRRSHRLLVHIAVDLIKLVDIVCFHCTCVFILWP